MTCAWVISKISFFPYISLVIVGMNNGFCLRLDYLSCFVFSSAGSVCAVSDTPPSYKYFIVISSHSHIPFLISFVSVLFIPRGGVWMFR